MPFNTQRHKKIKQTKNQTDLSGGSPGLSDPLSDRSQKSGQVSLLFQLCPQFAPTKTQQGTQNLLIAPPPGRVLHCIFE